MGLPTSRFRVPLSSFADSTTCIYFVFLVYNVMILYEALNSCNLISRIQ